MNKKNNKKNSSKRNSIGFLKNMERQNKKKIVKNVKDKVSNNSKMKKKERFI